MQHRLSQKSLLRCGCKTKRGSDFPYDCAGRDPAHRAGEAAGNPGRCRGKETQVVMVAFANQPERSGKHLIASAHWPLLLSGVSGLVLFASCSQQPTTSSL